MPKIELTQKAVEKLKPLAGKQLTIYDEKQAGLILRVNSSGAKAWRILLYKNRKTFSRSLGSFPEIGLKRARELAGEAKANQDRILAAPINQPANPTFKEIAENFLKREVRGKLRSADQVERAFVKWVYPVWENRPFMDIRRRDVASLLDSIENKGFPRTADIVLAYVRKLMNWQQSRDDDYISPIVRGMARTKPSERSRTRVLSDDEIRALWLATPKCEAPTFGNLVRMLLLTAQRRTKVATMKFDDVNDGVWTIATERREKGNAERLGLPATVLEIIAQQDATAISDYVFPASRIGRRKGTGSHFGAFSAFGQGKHDLDKLMAELLPADVPRLNWTLHDLRRTARSLMSRANVRPDIAERVLGHASLASRASTTGITMMSSAPMRLKLCPSLCCVL